MIYLRRYVEILQYGHFHRQVAFARGFPGYIGVGIILYAGTRQGKAVVGTETGGAAAVGRYTGKIKEAGVIYIVVPHQSIAAAQLKAGNQLVKSGVLPEFSLLTSQPAPIVGKKP